MEYKIDILNNNEFIVVQSLENGEQQFYSSNQLVGGQLSSFNSFIQLVNDKSSIEYTQIYVGENPIKRFVVLNVKSYQVDSIEEFLYDDLTITEKQTFDDFWNQFTL